MSIKTWATFYPDVLLSVPGCPDFLADNYLRKAAIDLSSKSKRLKYDMEPFDTIAGVSTYDLDPDFGMETTVILDASIDGKPIDPMRRDEIVKYRDSATEQGIPDRYLLSGDDETVRLWKTPDGVYSVSLTLALNPLLTATGIEAWFADRYHDAIVAGALAKLLALPKQAWTDGPLAMYHGELFKAGIRKASAEADKDGTRAALHTKKYGRA